MVRSEAGLAHAERRSGGSRLDRKAGGGSQALAEPGQAGTATGEHDPLQRHRTAWVSSGLDAGAMDMAAHGLLGLHDFASYCKAREGATTIRTLQAFSWHRDADGVLIGEVGADAFCHSMVRALVGACVEVGEGKLTPGDLVRLRDEQRRTSAFKVMPARGLTLLEVGYPADAELARRAEQTRGLRTL